MRPENAARKLSHRIEQLDKDIPALQEQLDKLLKERAASIAYLPFANSLEEGREEEVPPKPKRGRPRGRSELAYKEPPKTSSIGQAVALIRSSKTGLTADEVVELGRKAGTHFVRNSIVSQLRKLIVRPGSPLTKVGDRYVAMN